MGGEYDSPQTVTIRFFQCPLRSNSSYPENIS